MTILSLFESALATSADAAIQSPTGGFLGFLQKNPSVATVYALAVTIAHGYLSSLETPAATTTGAASGLVVPTVPKT